jgi:NADH-quinone oxidoreductase subunit A
MYLNGTESEVLHFIHIFIYFTTCCTVGALVVNLPHYFSANLPDFQKLSTYECGFDPFEDSRNIFDIRFYLIAVLFLIFDLEAIFFYPWISSLSNLNDAGFYFMIDFIIELLIGFIYVWHEGALDWN